MLRLDKKETLALRELLEFVIEDITPGASGRPDPKRAHFSIEMLSDAVRRVHPPMDENSFAVMGTLCGCRQCRGRL